MNEICLGWCILSGIFGMALMVGFVYFKEKQKQSKEDKND